MIVRVAKGYVSSAQLPYRAFSVALGRLFPILQYRHTINMFNGPHTITSFSFYRCTDCVCRD